MATSMYDVKRGRLSTGFPGRGRLTSLSSHPIWMALSYSLILGVGVSLAGCNMGPPDPELIAARFIDENADGAPQADESILLIFDRSLELEIPVKTGLRLLPQGSAGAYTIHPGTDPNTLRIELGAGNLDLTPAGVYGESSSRGPTGIQLNCAEVDRLLTSSGQPMRGNSSVVDLEPLPSEPPHLVDAEWIDRDGSVTVNEFDALLLTWDREVKTSPTLRRFGDTIPNDLIMLPVPDDRLDDRIRRSRVESSSGLSRHTSLVLGSRPQFSIQGEFERGKIRRFRGDPSGLAINGTAIRPHLALTDAQGVGVASLGVIDIRGECDPFQPAPDTFNLAGELAGHTATELPDGRVIVAGGWRDEERRSVFTDEIWMYEPSQGVWRGPWQLKKPRAWHTATYFPGFDEEPDTADDFILIVGGYSNRALEVCELIYPNQPPRDGEFGSSLVSTWLQPANNHPTPRYHHTAHALPGTSTIVIAGGLLSAGVLNGIVETIEVLYDETGSPMSAYKRQHAQLQVARIEHASVLVESEIGPLLFVYGGYGRGDLKSWQVEYERCEVLDRPELLQIDPSAPELKTTSWELATGTMIGIRRGLRIVTLAEEDHPWLVVGGTNLPPYKDNESIRSCREVYRIDLDLSGVTSVTERRPPQLRIVPAGELSASRSGIGVMRLEDGRVLILGGVRERERTRIAELYDPKAGTDGTIEPICRDLLSPRGAFPQGNFTVSRTYDEQFSNDRILIVGGTGPGEIGCEIFDASQ